MRDLAHIFVGLDMYSILDPDPAQHPMTTADTGCTVDNMDPDTSGGMKKSTKILNR